MLRIATIVMLLLFGVTAGIYVFMDAQQYYFKYVAGSEVTTKEHLETVKVSLKECGGRIGDEIWVKGNMYDVSSYVVVNDTAIVSVYHDTREQELVQLISDNFDSRNCAPATDHHIARYVVHLTDDGKILNTPYTFKLPSAPAAAPALYEFAAYPKDRSDSVSTPPPDRTLS